LKTIIDFWKKAKVSFLVCSFNVVLVVEVMIVVVVMVVVVVVVVVIVVVVVVMDKEHWCSLKTLPTTTLSGCWRNSATDI